MMKRSTKEAGQDILSAANDVYVSVSKTPAVTKFIWHINSKDVDDQEDMKRQSPNNKYLQGLSALLTVMVLWGIFWQINAGVRPSSSGDDAQGITYTLDQIKYDVYKGGSSADGVADLESSVGGRSLVASKADLESSVEGRKVASKADLDLSVGGRRVASKNLLEVNAEQQIPNRLEQSLDSSWGGNLAPVLHRNLRSHIDLASAN